MLSDNLRAIDLLIVREAANREGREIEPLSEEQAIDLLRYQGWGTLAEVFIDPPPPQWQVAAAQVRSAVTALTGERGYQACRHSILTAFYTSPWIVRGIYRLLERMGVGALAAARAKEGNSLRCLEPGCGTGLFIGMTPPQWGMVWSAVEPDPISYRIAKALYSATEIYNQLIEETDLPLEYFDIALGNVPFLQSVPHDSAFATWEFGGLHDYVIAKTMAALKPGGILAVLTSVGSLQSSRSQAFRERLAQQARLITAIKLPMMTFWGFSRTQIGADLLILQKRLPGQMGNSHLWTPLVEMPGFLNPETNQPLKANAWFARYYPECVIGKWTFDKHYGSARLTSVWEKPESYDGQESQNRQGNGVSNGEQNAENNQPTQLPQSIEEQFADMAEHLPIEQGEGWQVQAQGAESSAEAEADRENSQKSDRKQRSRSSNQISVPQVIKDDPFMRVHPSSYVAWEGAAWQYRKGMLHRVEGKSTSRRRRIIEMCRLKTAAHRVLELQRQGCSDEELRQAQRKLNQIYDLFVRDYGAIHYQGNVSAFGDDPDFPLLLSLEVWDADRPKETKKAAIFSERTIYLEPPRTAPRTAKEALVDSLAEHGKIDMVYMSSRYGKLVGEVITELQQGESEPLVFHDPKLEAWVTADEYLSGDVKLKLEEARTAALINRDYYLNVRALERVQPPDLLPAQIYVQLGSSWLPKETVAQFVEYMLEVPAEKVVVRHNRSINEWDVDVAQSIPDALNRLKWGTSRITGLRLIELTLNQQAPVIYDSMWNPRRKDYDQIKNHAETRRALNRSIQIKQTFKRWVWTEAERTYKLARLYNDQFNSVLPRQYNGAHLRYNLSGVSKAWQERLVDPTYHYQLDSCWRILVEGNTLGQIPVGGGKTAIMVVASQLLRQFGKCTKPAMIVPDHLVLQQASEALSIYPGLRVLLIASDLMPTPQKRRELINRCATGNWDLVICSQTAFASIPMHPETVERFQEEEFADLMKSWRGSYGGSTSGKRYTKDEERAMERYKSKVKANHQKLKRISVAYFELTGIDWLIVDECHDYLGLATNTRITGVLGLGSSNSMRAADLRYKVKFLAQLKGVGNGVVLMSGTPIRNTLGQAWVNLVYLMPEVLEEKGLLHFDSFIGTFAEAVTQTEVTGAGTLDIKTRLSNWSNLPEFRKLWNRVVHVIRESQLRIKRPRVNYKTVEVPASSGQLKFLNWLAGRVEAIKAHRGRIQKGDDNWCAVCSDTAQGVLDPRLLRQWKLQRFLTPEEIAGLSQEHTKVEQCIEDVYQSWADPTNTALRRVQLVFCDLGTPHSSDRWTVYRHSKERLMAMGVPQSEIAFIHDAKDDQAKAELFERVRSGKVRILYASTPKLGVGTQIPDRLFQLRHLSCPLRPTDIWQRDGRIVRPGNLHEEVEIYFYITTGKPVQITSADGKETFVQGISPDSWLYECVRRKAGFIEQGIFVQDEAVRTVEDIDEVSLDFATLMATATGDRRLLEKMNVDQEVNALLDIEAFWQSQQSIAAHQVKTIPVQIQQWRQKLEWAEQDLELARAAVEVDQQAFSLGWLGSGGRLSWITDRKAAAKNLWTWILIARDQKKSVHQHLGQYGQFHLWGRHGFRTVLELKSERTGMTYSLNTTDSAAGNLKQLAKLQGEVSKQISYLKEQIEASQTELRNSKAVLELPFEHKERLVELLERQTELAEALGLLDLQTTD